MSHELINATMQEQPPEVSIIDTELIYTVSTHMLDNPLITILAAVLVLSVAVKPVRDMWIPQEAYELY